MIVSILRDDGKERNKNNDNQETNETHAPVHNLKKFLQMYSIITRVLSQYTKWLQHTLHGAQYLQVNKQKQNKKNKQIKLPTTL